MNTYPNEARILENQQVPLVKSYVPSREVPESPR